MFKKRENHEKSYKFFTGVCMWKISKTSCVNVISYAFCGDFVLVLRHDCHVFRGEWRMIDIAYERVSENMLDASSLYPRIECEQCYYYERSNRMIRYDDKMFCCEICVENYEEMRLDD